MGKICWINGQPYLVSLPRGGEDGKDRNNQWDEMITFLGEDCNDVFHYEKMRSWCQGAVNTSYRVVRGYHSARFWGLNSAMFQRVYLGFRPVLIPLDSDTMKPDVSLLEDIPDGTRIALTSLYINEEPIPEPQDPTDEGDIADYISGTEVVLGNRDNDPKNWLHVIKFKNLLWMDRNILGSISWVDLKVQGFAE